MLLYGGGSRLVPSKLEQSVKDKGKVAETHGFPNDGFFDEPQLQTGTVCGPVWTELSSDSCTVDPSRIIGEDRAI